MNIVIVGGGTAGWLTASWISKFFPNISVTLVESKDIPKIGVGESVTPHVSAFFQNLGIDDHHWMLHTGSIYKFANKFVGWKNNNKGNDYFGFNYTTANKILYKDNPIPSTKEDHHYNSNDVRTTDTLLNLLKNSELDKFDRYFHSAYHYMEKNVVPFDSKGAYLLPPFFSWSQHINADLASDYCRDNIALPNGVIHIQSKILKVIKSNNKIEKVLLEDGREISGDLFVDCSGMHRVLMKELDAPVKEYKHHSIDSAWVCQLDYEDPESEMVNYTQSIAQDYGWMFKIGLYHRMGTGYCYSSSHTTDEQAEIYYRKLITNTRREPRQLKWNPNRLENSAVGNAVAIGLSSGFVEPLEANNLYMIVTAIRKLDSVLSRYIREDFLDFDQFNKEVGYFTDDIADFILVHYTLSDRTDSDFWQDSRLLGNKEQHKNLVIDKYHNEQNYMQSTIENQSNMFPDYMWAHLAYSWDIDLKDLIRKDISANDLEIAQLYYKQTESNHRYISSNSTNNYRWLQKNVYKDLSNSDWEEKYLSKSK